MVYIHGISIVFRFLTTCNFLLAYVDVSEKYRVQSTRCQNAENHKLNATYSLLRRGCWLEAELTNCGIKSKSKLYYDRQSVGQSVLVGAHLGLATYFYHSRFFFTVSGLLMWGALSDEKSGQ
jgi:hypothetical protein